MRKIVVALAAAVLALALVVWFAGQALVGLRIVRVADDLHMIQSPLGGNVAVLKTGAGAVIVDTMTFASQGAAILEAAQALTGEPVAVIVNSHYHFDHTHGNPAFPVDTRVVATERTLVHLRERDASYWTGDHAPLLPNETFEHEHEIALGSKTIRLLHPGRGHTDGDLVALFVEDGVLHAGDLYFNRRYPNIDLEAGGSVQLWGETLDRVAELPFEQVIPGHGELSDRAGLRQFRTFIEELAAVATKAAENGWTLAETQANGDIVADAGYEPISIPLVMTLDREFVVRRAWEEATGAVPRS